MELRVRVQFYEAVIYLVFTAPLIGNKYFLLNCYFAMETTMAQKVQLTQCKQDVHTLSMRLTHTISDNYTLLHEFPVCIHKITNSIG